MSAFVASGALHAYVTLLTVPSHLPLIYPFCFVACGFIVIGEDVIAKAAKKGGYYDTFISTIPTWVSRGYVAMTVFVLAHLFFWPDNHTNGVVANMVDNHMGF